jgi:hypothetical protein
MAVTSYGVNHPLAVKAVGEEAVRRGAQADPLRTVQGFHVDRIPRLPAQRDRQGRGRPRHDRPAHAADRPRRHGRRDARRERRGADHLQRQRLHRPAAPRRPLGGKMSEQRVPFEVREEAMSGLQDWWSDRIDTALFNQLAGATTQQTQANAAQSTSVDTRSAAIRRRSRREHQPHHLRPERRLTLEASLSATFKLNLADIDRAWRRRRRSTPAIRPLKVNGDSKYVLFVHPNQTTSCARTPIPGSGTTS